MARIKHFFLIGSILFLTSCSSIPDWYMNPPRDGNHLFAAKTAISSEMQLALDKATMEARAEIARQVETKISELQKKFTEELGNKVDGDFKKQFSKATKAVVNTTLHGTRVKEQEFFKEDKHWRAYVLVEYPWGEARSEFVKNVKRDTILYGKVKDTSAFEKLVKESR